MKSPVNVAVATVKRSHSEAAAKSRVVMMQDQSSVDWQFSKSSVSERAGYLLDTGMWSDCQFTVGLPPNVKLFKCHKMILAMASPVFEAMFFGGLGGDSDEPIKILDVQPDAFYVLLQ